MDRHRLAEERSIAYHQAVGSRLLARPEILDRARERVRGWLASGDVHAEYARAWDRLLREGPRAVALAIADRGETARALRQSTPFAGALSPRERWAIWREVRREAQP